MKKLLCLVFIALASTLCLGQNNEFPVFAGPESSFNNYFLSGFFKMEKDMEDICDTSIGLIEFRVNQDGNVTNVLVPSEFPEKISKAIETLVKQSHWTIPK